MSSPIVNLTLFDQDEQVTVDNSVAAIETLIPGIQLIEGNTEMVLIEAAALQIGLTQYTINQLGQSVLDNIIALWGLPRLTAVAAEGTITVTIAASTIGVQTLPAGSIFRVYNSDGSSLDLVTTQDVTHNPTDSLTFAAPVDVSTVGSYPNTLVSGTPCTLVNVLTWVDGAVIGSLTGGTDPETDAEFYPRAALFFQNQQQTLVLTPQFATAALDVDGVGRAFAITAWDGSGSTPGTVGGHVSVVVATASGAACSTDTKTAVLNTLTGQAIAGLTINVLDPVLKAFVVAVAVAVLPGFVADDVLANVTRAIQTFLDPSTWVFGAPLYINQLIVVAGEVPGVARVGTVTGTVGGTNITSYTPGPLDLPNGTAAVTATAI